MTSIFGGQGLQFVAWIIAYVEFVLALYVLLLNARHILNLHVSGFLLLTAVSNIALGGMAEATGAAEAAVSSYFMAATAFAFGPAMFLAGIAILKPEWLQGRFRRLWWILYGLVLLPFLLALVDGLLGTNLWYTGFGEDYAGGMVPIFSYVDGPLSLPIRIMDFYTVPVLILIPFIYIAFLDKEAMPSTRRLARLFLGTQIAVIGIQFGLRGMLPRWLSTLVTNVLIVIIYVYGTFRQMAAQRHLRRGRLRIRLILLILGTMLPLIIGVLSFLRARAGDSITQIAVGRLGDNNRALSSNVSLWLDLNEDALENLVSLPDIISMQPGRQRPILRAMDAAYPHIYLISTTDWEGQNVARSDNLPLKDYSREPWLRVARNARPGDPLTLVVAVDETIGQPILVTAKPIRSNEGMILGVAMFASTVSDITQEVVRAGEVGETGVAFIVDEQNRVVAHSDPAFSVELQDFDTYPPVYALRGGQRGPLSFTDEQGRRWQAYVDVLDNDWGVIIQQQESEFLAELGRLSQLTWVIIAVAGVILVGVIGVTIRQAVRPIDALTETATAIASGDLSRTAPVESVDEVGTLARTFNSMTDRLRGLIGRLEEEVEERTRDLERRSQYLEVSAEVSRAVTSILDVQRLTSEVVDLVRERFDFYHVSLFRLDETGREAVYLAGSGAGTELLDREGLRLPVGGSSMIGWTTGRGQVRVVQDATQDTVRLDHSLMPATRSEASFPLIARGQVIGALSVQSDQLGAFDPDLVSALGVIADQVAVTLENARLFSEAQEALESTRRAFGEFVQQGWIELLRSRADWGYRYVNQEILPVEEDWRPEMVRAMERGRSVVREDEEGRRVLAIPLKVRGQVVGVLDFRKDGRGEAWTEEERRLLEMLVDQLGQSLDNARLFQETQRRAAREEATRQITARMRETLDVDMVLRTAVREIHETMGLSQVAVQLAFRSEE